MNFLLICRLVLYLCVFILRQEQIDGWHDCQAIFAQHDVYQNKIEFLVVYHWLSKMLDYVNGARNILWRVMFLFYRMRDLQNEINWYLEKKFDNVWLVGWYIVMTLYLTKKRPNKRKQYTKNNHRKRKLIEEQEVNTTELTFVFILFTAAYERYIQTYNTL